MKAITLAAAAAMFVAGPVSAQTPDWTGLYAGGRVGYAATSLNSKARVLFDRNLDGSFGDTITTAAGANAFSPGFCTASPTAFARATIATATPMASIMRCTPVATCSSVGSWLAD